MKTVGIYLPNVKKTLCVLVFNEPLVQGHVQQLILAGNQLIENVIRPLGGLSRGKVGGIRTRGRPGRSKTFYNYLKKQNKFETNIFKNIF